MADRVSPEVRSRIMSRIHGGKDNGFEMGIHNWLKGNRIRHTMYPKVEGHPDVYLRDCDIYLFLDGCFWHCCPKHYRRPKSKLGFWIPHIEHSNCRRERKRRKLPYKWRRVWEHDFRNDRFKGIILKIVGDGDIT